MELYRTHEDSNRLWVCVHVRVGSYEPFPLVISTLVLSNYRLNEKDVQFFFQLFLIHLATNFHIYSYIYYSSYIPAQNEIKALIPY